MGISFNSVTNFHYLFKRCICYSYVHKAYSTVTHITRLATDSNLNHRYTGKLLQGLEKMPWTPHMCIYVYGRVYALKAFKKNLSLNSNSLVGVVAEFHLLKKSCLGANAGCNKMLGTNCPGSSFTTIPNAYKSPFKNKVVVQTPN